jgi:hypothetical protein
MVHTKKQDNILDLDSFYARERAIGGADQMQRAKVMQVLERNLKEAISNVKKDGYRRTLGNAHDMTALNVIEHRIRTDFQLTQDDRIQLLGDVERVATLES